MVREVVEEKGEKIEEQTKEDEMGKMVDDLNEL